MHTFHKRILKEYKRLQKNPLPGITIQPSETDSNDLSVFVFDITLPPDSDGVLHSIYRSDVFQLRIKITDDYPVDSPEVQFLNLHPDSKIPLHPHIYSNGHICLDLLGSGWTPACSMESILLSIQSMLSTNELAERPHDDQAYVRTAPLNPKKTTFDYHDDNV